NLINAARLKPCPDTTKISVIPNRFSGEEPAFVPFLRDSVLISPTQRLRAGLSHSAPSGLGSGDPADRFIKSAVERNRPSLFPALRLADDFISDRARHFFVTPEVH